MFILADVSNLPRRRIVGEFTSPTEAVEHLNKGAFKTIICEEDESNPGCFDLFLSSGGIEPKEH